MNCLREHACWPPRRGQGRSSASTSVRLTYAARPRDQKKYVAHYGFLRPKFTKRSAVSRADPRPQRPDGAHHGPPTGGVRHLPITRSRCRRGTGTTVIRCRTIPNARRSLQAACGTPKIQWHRFIRSPIACMKDAQSRGSIGDEIAGHRFGVVGGVGGTKPIGRETSTCGRRLTIGRQRMPLAIAYPLR